MNAISETPVAKGDKVVIKSLEGLVVKVEPVVPPKKEMPPPGGGPSPGSS
jgi:membrane-bound ClpP family serine protease